MNKISTLLTTSLLAGLAATTQASIVTDSDFSAASNGGANTELALATNNQIYAGTSGSGTLATDLGWFAGGAIAPGNSELSDTAPRLTYTPGSLTATTNDWTRSIGQINTDNGASTGEWALSFDVSFAAGWDVGDEVQFFVQVFGISNSLGFDAGIQLVNSGFNPAYTDIGTVSTQAITTAGSYSTGAFDLGTGHDLIGFRVQAIEPLGNVGFGDDVYINSISASAIPEPGTLVLVGLALGGLLLHSRFRR